MNNEHPVGEHYYKVFHCHGCQSCWRLDEQDNIVKYPHILSQADVTAEIEQLKVKISTVQDMFSDALQSDLEHGVKSLNENAAKEFHEKYPMLTQALERLSDLS